MLVDPDGRDVIFSMSEPPGTSNKWEKIPSVISKDNFIGWGHNGIRNCYKLANYQLSIEGYKANGRYYQAYTEQKGVNPKQTQKAIEYITESLQAGKPVMVGVDDQDGHPGNADKTTDHWIVIVGMDSDNQGNYFHFYDNATNNKNKGTSTENKLYYDTETGKITGTADNNYSRNAQRDYTVTRVKETEQEY